MLNLKFSVATLLEAYLGPYEVSMMDFFSLKQLLTCRCYFSESASSETSIHVHL